MGRLVAAAYRFSGAVALIGLPELQRPFVWPNVNVRNLFDSLYRGYPVGFLFF